MIRVDRRLVPAPASLTAAMRSGPNKGLTEREVVIRAFDAHVSGGGQAAEFVFSYAAYKKRDVRQALHLLFHGKCAYCESRYAGTQPMDVEHWRPKAQVHEFDSAGNRSTIGGYPWLASEWENLLPSCIDCNREREQRDALTQVVEVRGKANQFPVTSLRMTPPTPGGPMTAVDDATLLNPTTDDPSEHLEFRDDGTVLPRSASQKGADSIRVYALNRSELAFERLGIARLIEQRLTTIETLAAVLADQPLSEDLRLNLQDLVAHEINALYELTEPRRAYSEMARQIIEDYAPGQVHPPGGHGGALWSAPVTSMLARFHRHAGGVDHTAVATQLAGLGFEPHLPRRRDGSGTSTTPYIRWSYTGQLRLVRLYQNTRGLVSDSEPQLNFARTINGAVGPAGKHPNVRFPYGQSSVETVMTAAATWRRWADNPVET